MTERQKILKELRELEQRLDAEEAAGLRCPYCGSDACTFGTDQPPARILLESTPHLHQVEVTG